MNNKTTKIYNLGRNIFTRRKELGMSQNSLAEKLDISREHLAKIETAKRTVSLDLLIEIADALNTKVKDLIDF
ncbi:MAG: helix-turn-helix transcriptional regulator [Candidatus Gastranaerophilaceae bacterium]|nr:helix-turn-helix transcriptional regulator [Cyanobacteriota bacterium]